MVPFLLLLAIASDALGFLMLALFNPAADLHLAQGALIMAVAIGIAFSLRRARVKSFWTYLLAAGGVSWWALYRSGLHPALALVPIVPFLPHAARDPGFFVDASPTAKDALSQFETWWRYPAQAALLFFGLVNAGVPFRALEAGTWGLPIAVIAGKPIGILMAVGVAVAAGLTLPQRVDWRDLVVVGLVAAIGFSIGLFFCSALLPPGQLRSETSMGVLLTLAGAPLALAAARLLHVGRFARH
jgi:NhaA family Na+:H+ antiporter